MSINEMAGSFHKTAFQLTTAITYYKALASRQYKRQQEKIYSLTKKLDEAEHSEEELTK